MGKLLPMEELLLVVRSVMLSLRRETNSVSSVAICNLDSNLIQIANRRNFLTPGKAYKKQRLFLIVCSFILRCHSGPLR